MDTLTQVPEMILGLPVLDEDEAMARGFHSITTAINRETEKDIMSGVAERRNPERCCWIHCYGPIYELAVIREDISHAATE